jgi:16S rRNA (adenine1518-N6/adenine1519-N6)-dimethyltransferase
MNKLLSLEQTIKQYGLQPNKKLGQHFLTDMSLLNNIVSYGGDLEGVNVIEVGAGPGGLTRAVLASNAKSVTVIELDDRALPALTELQNHDPRLNIIVGDGLKYSILEVPSPRLIIANLPYNVGTAMLINWLKNIYFVGQEAAVAIVVMLQHEVVERIVAPVDSSDYGRLAILCQWLCEVEHCLTVPPSAFTPPPKVMSSVVRLTPRVKPAFAADFVQLEQFLKVAFGQRRKMLRSTLKNWQANAVELLEMAGIDGARRAETLTLAEIGELIKLKCGT